MRHPEDISTPSVGLFTPSYDGRWCDEHALFVANEWLLSRSLSALFKSRHLPVRVAHNLAMDLLRPKGQLAALIFSDDDIAARVLAKDGKTELPQHSVVDHMVRQWLKGKDPADILFGQAYWRRGRANFEKKDGVYAHGGAALMLISAEAWAACQRQGVDWSCEGHDVGICEAIIRDGHAVRPVTGLRVDHWSQWADPFVSLTGEDGKMRPGEWEEPV